MTARRMACLAALVVVLAACQTSPQGQGADRAPALDLLVRTPDGRSMRYRVDRAGVVAFAGGEGASAERFTWSRPLTDEEIRDLTRLLEEDWSGPEPVASGEPAGLRYELEIEGLVGAAGDRRLKLRGGSPQAGRLHQHMIDLTNDRHATFLQRLPRAGEQRP